MDKAGPGPSTPTSGDPDHPEGLTGPLPTASGESPQLEAASSPSSRKPASGVGRAILRNLGALREHFLCREEGKPQVEAAPTGSGPGGSREGEPAGALLSAAVCAALKTVLRRPWLTFHHLRHTSLSRSSCALAPWRPSRGSESQGSQRICQLRKQELEQERQLWFCYSPAG